MPSWKKLVTSGSSPSFNNITATSINLTSNNGVGTGTVGNTLQVSIAPVITNTGTYVLGGGQVGIGTTNAAVGIGFTVGPTTQVTNTVAGVLTTNRIIAQGNITASNAISASGTGSFTGVVIDDYITHAHDANSYFGFSEPDDWHLITNGNNVIRQHNNGTLYLYHSNAQILNTSATGINVIGEITASGHLNFATSSITSIGAITSSRGATFTRDVSVGQGLTIGGGYGSTGLTVTNAGVVTTNGAITTDGALSTAQLVGPSDRVYLGTVHEEGATAGAGAGFIQAYSNITASGAITASSVIANNIYYYGEITQIEGERGGKSDLGGGTDETVISEVVDGDEKDLELKAEEGSIKHRPKDAAGEVMQIIFGSTIVQEIKQEGEIKVNTDVAFTKLTRLGGFSAATEKNVLDGGMNDFN